MALVRVFNPFSEPGDNWRCSLLRISRLWTQTGCPSAPRSRVGCGLQSVCRVVRAVRLRLPQPPRRERPGGEHARRDMLHVVGGKLAVCPTLVRQLGSRQRDLLEHLHSRVRISPPAYPGIDPSWARAHSKRLFRNGEATPTDRLVSHEESGREAGTDHVCQVG